MRLIHFVHQYFVKMYIFSSIRFAIKAILIDWIIDWLIEHVIMTMLCS